MGRYQNSYIQYQYIMYLGYVQSELNSPLNGTKPSVGVAHPLLFVPVHTYVLTILSMTILVT